MTAVFEPTGEECATGYDYTGACPECGLPRRIASDLVLDLRRIPKSKDIARTLAEDEIIVTARLAELMVKAKLTGFTLGPVRHKARYEDDAVDLTKVPSGRELLRRGAAIGAPHPTAEFDKWLNRPEQRDLAERARKEHAELLARRARRRAAPLPEWRQLLVTSRALRIVAPTRCGNNPFDDDPEGRGRCSRGHVLGLNLLSEVTVACQDWDGSDVCRTEQAVGLLWPPGHMHGVMPASPLILVSPRFRQVLLHNKVKGWRTDVAYLR